MAELIPITCPNCSAALQIEDNRTEAFCTYCGARFSISNDNEHIVRTIDEAAITRSNNEKEIELRKMELELEKRKYDDKFTIIMVVAIVVIVFLTCLIVKLGIL